MRVEEAVDDRGRKVAIKRADGGEESARLRREADLLEVAAHPGLVELVAFEDGPKTTLRTLWVGGPSLADVRPLDVEEVAGVVAATASTLADLHAVGLVHGAVEPAHVVLDEEGRPVLCGLGSGGLAGEPCGPGGAVLDAASDVADLGQVLSALVADATGRVRGAGADALRRLADRARGPAGNRPTARELADAVHDAVGGARLPRQQPEPVETPTPVRPGLEGLRRPVLPRPVAPPRRRLRLAGLGLFAAAGVGAVVLLGSTQASSTAPSSMASPAVPTTVRAVPAAPSAPEPVVPTTSARPVVPAGCPALEGPLSADVDGDGCADPVRYVDGVVEAAGRRWEVGQAGDVVALGDWTCAGRRSLAVLRPSTGEVFAFTGWAQAGVEVQAPLVGRVTGGQALRAADLDGDGCNELVVERSAGAPAVLHPRRGAG
ncbi:MAG TPA: hypothetical protein VF045_09640 [Acidimicrobiales bacterium]